MTPPGRRFYGFFEQTVLQVLGDEGGNRLTPSYRVEEQERHAPLSPLLHDPGRAESLGPSPIDRLRVYQAEECVRLFGIARDLGRSHDLLSPVEHFRRASLDVHGEYAVTAALEVPGRHRLEHPHDHVGLTLASQNGGDPLHRIQLGRFVLGDAGDQPVEILRFVAELGEVGEGVDTFLGAVQTSEGFAGLSDAAPRGMRLDQEHPVPSGLLAEEPLGVRGRSGELGVFRIAEHVVHSEEEPFPLSGLELPPELACMLADRRVARVLSDPRPAIRRVSLGLNHVPYDGDRLFGSTERSEDVRVGLGALGDEHLVARTLRAHLFPLGAQDREILLVTSGESDHAPELEDVLGATAHARSSLFEELVGLQAGEVGDVDDELLLVGGELHAFVREAAEELTAPPEQAKRRLTLGLPGAQGLFALQLDPGPQVGDLTPLLLEYALQPTTEVDPLDRRQRRPSAGVLRIGVAQQRLPLDQLRLQRLDALLSLLTAVGLFEARACGDHDELFLVTHVHCSRCW